MDRGDVRRGRLRLLRVAGTEGDAFDPPLVSLSPSTLRRIDPGDVLGATPLQGAREELWSRAEGARMRCVMLEPGKLEVTLERPALPAVKRRLIRVPHGEPGEGVARYIGRWEHARDALVISAKGAGLLLRSESTTVTFDREPERVDVYEGEGVCLALRNVPNGARVVAADGVVGLSIDGFVSDVKVPDLERGPHVSIHPRESFLRGFAPVGFEASFAGLDVAGFAPAQIDGSPDVARFTKKPGGIAWAAMRPLDPVRSVADVDGLLTASLAAELAPSPTTGRVRLGKAGTITLSDGRGYRVRAGAREHLPGGAIELVTAAVLDGALLVRVGAPMDTLRAPDANDVLATLQRFLLALHVMRLSTP